MNKYNRLQKEKAVASTVCEQDMSEGISNYAKILDNVDMCLICLALQKHVFLSEHVIQVYYIKSDMKNLVYIYNFSLA